MTPVTLALPDEAATLALGHALAAGARPGLVLTLDGDLGTGKTTLVRGLLRGLGFEGRVRSPTYAVVEPYELSRLVLYHLDLYRIESDAEFEERGLRDCFGDASLCAVEWPDRAPLTVPPADLAIQLVHAADGGRDATLRARSDRGIAWLNAASVGFVAGSPRTA
jgi:tRNA threonylcarbamoyladenosine biosynthesis protein TsaE